MILPLLIRRMWTPIRTCAASSMSPTRRLIYPRPTSSTRGRLKLVEVVGWSCRRCHPESVATPERRPRHLNKQIKVISITHHRHFRAQNLFKINTWLPLVYRIYYALNNAILTKKSIRNNCLFQWFIRCTQSDTASLASPASLVNAALYNA